jgi:uncharacterized membrane protein YhhN
MGEETHLAAWIIVPVACLLLIGLLAFERAQKAHAIIGLKTTLSLLFVVACLVGRHLSPSYSVTIATALFLHMIGDVLLGLRRPRPFKIGIAFFLTGHVLYIIAFFGLSSPQRWVNAAIVPVGVGIAVVFVWLRPYLKSMLVPIVVYMLVIGVMVVLAFAVNRTSAVHRPAAWAILLGAISVFVSDIFVARQRFVTQAFTNRLIGLPLYYVGQFLMAFSVSLIR